MTDQSIIETITTINRHKIEEVLLKSDALLTILLRSELQTVPVDALYGYLWVLDDLISDAREQILQ